MNVLEKILKLRNERNWTEYKLSEKSGIPQSTISSWYRKGSVPSIASLELICKAFNVSLSQFFADSEQDLEITAEQKKLIDAYSKLSEKQKESILELMENM